ncbi:uncharacterized protein [Malus domestica]|uniref:uncharacterized protein n=1 Tax=Malus domestica TaxID=3750 RepID=UPI0039767D02
MDKTKYCVFRRGSGHAANDCITWMKYLKKLVNEAKCTKYEALLEGLQLAKDIVVKKLTIYSNSQLITNQTLGEYVAKHPRMARYLEKVREQLVMFQAYTLTQVPPAENAHADALADLGSALNHLLKHFIPIEYLEKSSIDEKPAVEVAHINTTLSWQDPINDCIVNRTLPINRLESKKLQMEVAHYYMWNDILVRISISRPHLCCLSHPDDLKVLSSKPHLGLLSSMRG